MRRNRSLASLESSDWPPLVTWHPAVMMDVFLSISISTESQDIPPLLFSLNEIEWVGVKRGRGVGGRLFLLVGFYIQLLNYWCFHVLLLFWYTYQGLWSGYIAVPPGGCCCLFWPSLPPSHTTLRPRHCVWGLTTDNTLGRRRYCNIGICQWHQYSTYYNQYQENIISQNIIYWSTLLSLPGYWVKH